MSKPDSTFNALDPTSTSSYAEREGQRDRRPSEQPPEEALEAPFWVDNFPAHSRLHHLETQKQDGYHPWKRDRHINPRPQSPALPWHKEYSQLDPKSGRVLVIDFIRADQSQNRKRKVVAQEVDCLDGLRKLYKDPRRGAEANLRLLHVQNAPWATQFLLRKFNIDGRDELVGSNFGRYAKSTKPDTRGGRPFPNARTWRVQHDPWRGISKTSFGFEYLKEYEVRDPSTEGRTFDEKMMELNGYDEEENPAYGYDVYIQRFACYFQHKEDPPSPPFDGANGISNPYKVDLNGYAVAKKQKEYLPQLSSLDNENAIILFDNSQSGSFEDCLIPARSEWETHWRRLPFYLAYEAREILANDDLLGRQCARMILDDVFRALAARWEILLDTCQTHVSILEDKIYEQPADETRAPELWRNSSLWLQVEKLITAHMAVVREMRVRLRELVADLIQPANASGSNNNPNADAVSAMNEDDWLEEIPGDFDRIAITVEEDLVKPTQALISLLYQSVTIRDSRLSLQINTSMWRLSWITFIFLPLTFMVGFFGMNVDIFSNDPSMKWYFIVTIPFMLLVLGGWYIMKHILLRQRQTPYQRGIYESFFHDLAVSYPTLWSRVGPREYIVPRTRMDRWKWSLIKRWARPERTIKAGQSNAHTAAPDDLSRWSKCKRYLIRRWTNEMVTFDIKTDQQIMDEDEEVDLEQGSVLLDTLVGATEMLTVPGQPVASAALERWEKQKEERRRHKQQQQQQEQHGVLAARPNEDFLSLHTTAAAVEPLPRLRNPNIRLERALSPLGRRANSSSPRGRRSTPGDAHGGGGSNSGSRNSSVLVEEEDPSWINQLGREGKGWYWRPGSPSPHPSSSPGNRASGEQRRWSSGNGGESRHVFIRGIDQTVERADASGIGLGVGVDVSSGSGEPASTVSKAPSPLGVMTGVEDQDSVSDCRATGEGGDTMGNLDGDSSKSDSESSGNQEAKRAAEETAGRPAVENTQEKEETRYEK